MAELANQDSAPRKGGRREIKGAEIFAVGEWNGITITSADLVAIKQNFYGLESSGRIPLKLGHDNDAPLKDGAPAYGWVSRVYISATGTKLLADFSDVPDALASLIHAGNYKFCSVELLKNPTINGQTVNGYVLDSIALLGAAPPAVTILKDLQRLVASRASAGAVGERMGFRRPFTSPAEPAIAATKARRKLEPAPAVVVPDRSDNELRAENERLRAQLEEATGSLQTFQRNNVQESRVQHQRMLVTELEAAVRRGDIVPANRERFRRLKNLDDLECASRVSLEELQLYLRSQEQTELLKGMRGNVIAMSRNPRGPMLEGSSGAFDRNAVIREVFTRADEAAKATGRRGLDPFDAFFEMMKRDPALAQQVYADTFEQSS